MATDFITIPLALPADMALLNGNAELSARNTEIRSCDESAAEVTESGFIALAVRFQRRYKDSDLGNPYFPLRQFLCLRSNISLEFTSRDIHDYDLSDRKGRLSLNILTLAGVNGVLPLRITEDILAAKKYGGKTLHEFFDLLNRRFWELFFQSYRIGTRPPYGFNDTYAQRSIQEIAQGCVGISFTPSPVETSAPPDFQNYLLRYCFNNKNGTGGPKGLAELLSRSIARPVYVSDWSACKLPVPDRYQMRLSKPSSPLLLGKCVLGRRTKVARFLSISVSFEAGDWTQFCPVEGGWAIRTLVGALQASLVGRIVVLSANYKVLVMPSDTAPLGKKSCRLGWGARLAGAPAHTSLVQISSLAISNIKEKP